LPHTAVPLDPGENMKAAKDFLVLHAHIVAAAESLCDTLGGNLIESSEAIVDKFVQIVLPVPPKARKSTSRKSSTSRLSTITGQSTTTGQSSTSRQFTTTGQSTTIGQSRKPKDQVFLYATEVTLGLLWMNFHDATREEDGDRLICVWKFL